MTSSDSHQEPLIENESIDIGPLQIEKLMKIVAYRQKSIETACISFTPEVHARVHFSLASPFKRAPKSGAGLFDNLPEEIWMEIIERLDMQTLFRLRHVNRRTRKMVDSVKEYKRVAAHGLDMYCALLRTRVAPTITLSSFYRILCTNECSICQDSAEFVSLVTWSRLCFYCINNAEAARVVSHWSLIFDLVKKESGRQSDVVPLKVLPGVYTTNKAKPALGTLIVSAAEASRVDLSTRYQVADLRNWDKTNSLAACFSAEEMHQISRRIATLRAQQAMHGFWGDAVQQQRIIDASIALQDEPNSLLRCASCCHLVYYNKESGHTEKLVSCAGCRFLDPEFDHDLLPNEKMKQIYKQYSRDGLLRHFRVCGQAQLLWKLSEHGTKTPVYPSRGIFYP